MTPTIIPCGSITVELWTELDGPIPPEGPEVSDRIIDQVEREIGAVIVSLVKVRELSYQRPELSRSVAIRMAVVSRNRGHR